MAMSGARKRPTKSPVTASPIPTAAPSGGRCVSVTFCRRGALVNAFRVWQANSEGKINPSAPLKSRPYASSGRTSGSCSENGVRPHLPARGQDQALNALGLEALALGHRPDVFAARPRVGERPVMRRQRIARLPAGLDEERLLW